VKIKRDRDNQQIEKKKKKNFETLKCIPRDDYKIKNKCNLINPIFKVYQKTGEEKLEHSQIKLDERNREEKCEL
jgi:hypothetical protein